jgi:hypothetical protein
MLGNVKPFLGWALGSQLPDRLDGQFKVSDRTEEISQLGEE